MPVPSPSNSIRLFVSTVSSEFRSYRDSLSADIKGPHVEIKVQEDFINLGGDTLQLLDDYIASCDGVIHLIGEMTGSVPPAISLERLLQRHHDFGRRVPTVATLLPTPGFSYTQWEAYLAIYHDRSLFIFQASAGAPTDTTVVPNATEQASQAAHVNRLKNLGRWPGRFLNQERLSTLVLRTLLSETWAEPVSVDDKPPVLSSPKLRYECLQGEFVGRDAELSRLTQAWTDDKKMIVVINAWGGVGKTALVAQWLAEMASLKWRGAHRVFDWSFYLEGTRPDGDDARRASTDAFFDEALTFFGAPTPHPSSPHERGSLLAKLLGQTKSLLVLDGIEPLQFPPGSPQAGQVSDLALSTLLKSLALQNAGLCIVTTRERVTNLQTFYGKTVDEMPLTHLSAESGAELLKLLKVTGTVNELQEASREVKGHALTLQLMGRYLFFAYGGDVRKRDLFGFTEADNETQGGHAFRILRAYESWLASGGKGGQRQLAILRLLGLFDRPADPGCVMALRKAPPIAMLTDKFTSLNDEQWNIAIKGLEEIGLVERLPYVARRLTGYDRKIAEEAMEAGRRFLAMNLPSPTGFHPPVRIPEPAIALEIHPLLREYFAKRLLSFSPKAWRAGNRRLFEYLKESVPFWPEGIEGLTPLYQAVANGCQADLEQKACTEVYRDRICRGTGINGFYSSKKLGLIGADLAAVGNFFLQPWRTVSPKLSDESRAWLFHAAAYRLRALGRLADAEEPERSGLEGRVAQQDWRNAATSAGHLSQLQLILGEISVAVATGEQSIAFADRSQSNFERVLCRAMFADALHQAGQHARSLAWFQAAEAIWAAFTPTHPWLSSLQGFRYCDLLLADAERDAWRITLSPNAKISAAVPFEIEKRAKSAIEIAQRENWILDIAADRVTLARIGLYRSVQGGTATGRPVGLDMTACDAAVNGLMQSGNLDEVPRALLTRAWARFLNDDERGATRDLEDAWDIAEPGLMRLHMADIQLTRARLFHDLAALAEARVLIDRCGYDRRREELVDSETALAKGPLL